MEKYTTINEYLKTLPESTQEVLQTLRETIQKEAPETVEAISYGMPTFKFQGKNLIHFAGWKDHIAVYPTASKLEAVADEVAQYRTGKGTLQFSLDKALPLDLIRRIVSIRIQEIEKKLQ